MLNVNEWSVQIKRFFLFVMFQVVFCDVHIAMRMKMRFIGQQFTFFFLVVEHTIKLKTGSKVNYLVYTEPETTT